MLYEGNVLACIQIVDEVSIATSVNFNIHILIDPNDGATFVESDDYTNFQKAVIQLTTIQEKSRKQLIDQKLEFEDMQLTFIDMQQNISNLNNAFDNLNNNILDKIATIESIIDKKANITDIYTKTQIDNFLE